MWGDHHLQRIALKNPLRWSASRSVAEVVAELETLRSVSRKAQRPVVVDNGGQVTAYASVEEALFDMSGAARSSLRRPRSRAFTHDASVATTGVEEVRQEWLDKIQGVRVLEDAVWKSAPEAVRADREIVLVAVVKRPALVLESCSAELQGDVEVVLAAVERFGAAIECAAPSLKEDRNFVLHALCKNPHALLYVPDFIKEDPAAIFIAKCTSAPSEVRSNRRAVLAAVEVQGAMLQHASDSLRGDREVVVAALRSDPQAIKHASARLQLDRERLLKEAARPALVLAIVFAETYADGFVLVECIDVGGQQLASLRASLARPLHVLLDAFVISLGRRRAELRFTLADGRVLTAKDDHRPLGEVASSPAELPEEEEEFGEPID